jgi:hypothetical protein
MCYKGCKLRRREEEDILCAKRRRGGEEKMMRQKRGERWLARLLQIRILNLGDPAE